MKKPKKNQLEWSVFFLSFVLLLVVWGLVLYLGFTSGSEPPLIRVKLHEPKQNSDTFLIRVDLENSGDETAENVHAEIVLRNGKQDVEKASLQISKIPRHSKRSGYVVFRTDPSSVENVDARVLGFETPSQ